jgi:hypothetical protein
MNTNNISKKNLRRSRSLFVKIRLIRGSKMGHARTIHLPALCACTAETAMLPRDAASRLKLGPCEDDGPSHWHKPRGSVLTSKKIL